MNKKHQISVRYWITQNLQRKGKEMSLFDAPPITPRGRNIIFENKQEVIIKPEINNFEEVDSVPQITPRRRHLIFENKNSGNKTSPFLTGSLSHREDK